MPDCGSHRYEGFVGKLRSLNDRVRAYENVVSDFDFAGDMGAVLDNTVAADGNALCTDQSGTVPDRRINSNSDFSKDSAIGGDELSSLQVGLRSPVVEIAKTGHQSIFSCIFTFNLSSGNVQRFAKGAVSGGQDSYGYLVEGVINNAKHFDI